MPVNFSLVLGLLILFFCIITNLEWIYNNIHIWSAEWQVNVSILTSYISRKKCRFSRFSQFHVFKKCCCHQLGPECPHHPDYILPTDRTLRHLFSTLGASTHMTTFKHYTVYWMIHAYFAKFLVPSGVFT